jgi:hypothetical protein
MLKKIFILSILSLASVQTATAAPATALETEDPEINQKIDEAVLKAESDAVQKFKNATSRENVPMWSDKLALENAAIQLEVKRTIANNFKGTESLRNAAIRAKLLEILNKPDVTQADLAELQNLVNQFKSARDVNIRIEDQQTPADVKPLNN